MYIRKYDFGSHTKRNHISVTAKNLFPTINVTFSTPPSWLVTKPTRIPSRALEITGSEMS
jgi:hypothetical protein